MKISKADNLKLAKVRLSELLDHKKICEHARECVDICFTSETKEDAFKKIVEKFGISSEYKYATHIHMHDFTKKERDLIDNEIANLQEFIANEEK